MKRYFIETSTIVNFLRDRQNAVYYVENLEGELASSYICLAELYEGIFRTREKDRDEKALLNFFTGLDRIYGLDQEAAENFGRIRAELKRQGKVIEDLDILIAATCLAHNLTLVTHNIKHFKRVRNLKIMGLSSLDSIVGIIGPEDGQPTNITENVDEIYG